MQILGIFVRKRLVFVLMAFILAFSLLVLRIGWLETVQGEFYQQMGEDIRMREIPIEAGRGTIYDCRGNSLAVSVNVDSIYALPRKVVEPEKAAQLLAPLLEMESERLLEILTRNSGYEWLKRKVRAETAQKVLALQLKGVYVTQESQRYYPHSSLAAHVLGFTGVDSQGLAGLEKIYDENLKGINGSIGVEKDAAGRELPDGAEKFQQPRPGNDLFLTLDQNIQYFAERELDKAVARYNPALAVIMVMEVQTGNIWAMASRPTYDCNKWKEAESTVWNRNPAVWYNYEPGSTFKIITLAAALNEKVVGIEDNFFDPGYISVADRQIHCWKRSGHGSQTFAEAVMNSCNPVFAQVGLSLGLEKYYQYLQAFGLGQKTGSGLPGEASGIIIPQDKATELNLAVMAMGQSIAVTPLQLLRAVAAVANGGVMMQPRLVEKVVSPEGKVVQSFAPREVGRVISPEAAKQAAALLEKVVAEGTGRNAFVEGYRTAGKTGTAQVVGENGGYVSGKYVASFAGFAPADAPRFAVLIMIAEPQGGVYYGGQVAAPIFQALAGDILHYLEIPADLALVKPPDPELWYEEEVKTQVEVPEVLYCSLNEAAKILAECGLAYQVQGEGEIVYQQIPAAGTKVYSGSQVLLQLEPEQQNLQVTVPKLVGLTMAEAEKLLVKLNLDMEISGQGLVVSQEPEPGTLVNSGQIIRLKFSDQPVESEVAPIITPELIRD